MISDGVNGDHSVFARNARINRERRLPLRFLQISMSEPHPDSNLVEPIEQRDVAARGDRFLPAYRFDDGFRLPFEFRVRIVACGA